MKKIKIVVNEYEYRTILNVVNEYRNKQINAGKSVDFVTEILGKLLKTA